MTIAIKKMFAQILFWIYELLDNIFEMFQVLCGIQKVNVENEDGSKTLLNVFLESNTVTQAFFLILLVAVVVAGLATITSVVKNIVNLKGGERKSHAKTLGQGFGTIIISLTMAFIMIIGINLSGEVLKSISNATSTTVESSFSNDLFGMSIEKTYDYEYVPVIEEVTDENGNTINQNKVDINGDIVYKKEIKKDENGNPIFTSGWVDDKMQIIDFSNVSPDIIFGVKGKNIVGFEKDDSGYATKPIVYLDSFNFLTAYIVVIVMIVALVFCMLGLVKRVFDIVMLFITLPLISATIPLDDGARFKSWRDTVISKVVLAYGAVLSVNVFLLIVPIINNMQFEELGWSGFLENLFKIFLMMGGALSINGGQLLLSRLIGTGADESREMAHSARALLGGMGMAGGIMRGAKNLVFGGANKFGRERTGVFNLGARLGNLVGEKVGKDKYKNSVGGRLMRNFGKMPQLQKQDATMTNMAGNIRTIADVLTGGFGGNNGLSNSNNQNFLPSNRNNSQPEKQGNGVSSLVGNVLTNSTNNNAFSKSNKK